MADALSGQPSAADIAEVSIPARVGGANTAVCPGTAAGISCAQKLIRAVCRVVAKARGASVDNAAPTVDCSSGPAKAGLANPGTDPATYVLRLAHHACALVAKSRVSGCAHNAACRVVLDSGMRNQISAGLLYHLLLVTLTYCGCPLVDVLRYKS